jgi:putative protease
MERCPRMLVSPRRPEILAPAGDTDALAAALAAGADAVYLGLDDGFNARARAANFPSSELAAVARQVHQAGARLYVTLNTLVFEPELAIVEELVRRVADAGADAAIVQDPAVAMLCARHGLATHASTQMTASSPEAVTLLAGLGIARVVVPRELSVDDIRAYAAASPIPLEVFVHGALCVAWSGQCLSSEAWGGRSANRGQCAQACRLPYDLVVDGEARDLGEVAYLLSPRDLVGLDHVRALAAIDGVASFKIEGRLKGPAYVALATAQYRAQIDDGFTTAIPTDRDALAIAYSRGASAGFLGGIDHQTLVDGRAPGHRGVLLGTVVAVDGNDVRITRGTGTVAPRAGMGVVFDTGHPETKEPGGPIFRVDSTADGWRLGFGAPGPDLPRVRAGHHVWVTSDPRVTAVGERAAAAGAQPLGRIPVALHVRGTAGAPLAVTARAGAREVVATTRTALAPARGAGIDAALLRDKLGALGGTAYHLADLVDDVPPALHVPVGELKQLRRDLVAALDSADDRPARVPRVDAALPAIAPLVAAPVVVPLVRDDAQLDAVLDAGAREVELDWMELVGLGRAVSRARARGARVVVATTRVQKPGEARIDAHLLRLEPDGVLIRSWGSLATLRAAAHASTQLLGDFSLNITNSVTARWVLGHGLVTATAAHDLDRDQLLALLDAAPRGRIAVTIHHHIPTFHTEHCVYAHLLSEGRDHRSCGRPCEHHQVALRDRVGLVHPVLVDVGCRNTVFNAQAQSAASLVPALVARGVTRLRVELVRETAAEAARTYTAYLGLVTGSQTPADTVRAVAAHEQFGVTRGTMRTLAVLR